MNKSGKGKFTNLDVINELDNLFINNSEVHQKIKIIELYLKSDTEQEFMNEYKIFLENSSLTYKHLKPSRIQNIINSFIQNNNNAGYIQPIGKHIFLDKFLEKYPSPRFIGFGEEYWTTDSLAEYIRLKYKCNITSDTIRKKLTSLKKQFKESGYSPELEYRNFLLSKIVERKDKKMYIYFFQLYYNPYPFLDLENKDSSKNIKPSHNNRKSSFVGCIYGKSPSIKPVLYRRKPYFQLSANYETHIPNLDYYLNIPIEEGLILIDDTYDSRKIIKDYYFWCFSQKDYIPKYRLYFLPNDIYTSLPILEDFDVATLLFRSILERYGTEAFDKIQDLSEFADYFDHCIVRKDNESFYNTPKLLKKI